MQQPLLVEIWGKQADGEQAIDTKKVANSKHAMSTKQLMNADSISKVNSVSATTRDDDNRYKLMSELNSLKKRNDRLNSRMVRVDYQPLFFLLLLGLDLEPCKVLTFGDIFITVFIC